MVDNRVELRQGALATRHSRPLSAPCRGFTRVCVPVGGVDVGGTAFSAPGRNAPNIRFRVRPWYIVSSATLIYQGED